MNFPINMLVAGDIVEYTRKPCLGDSTWYKAKVIGFDNREPVLKTEKGNYHRRPVAKYAFRLRGDNFVEIFKDGSK